MHAYPIMNKGSLPKHLDLGKVAIGETVSEQLQLSCKVALDFDFKVTVVKHNKNFTVAPMSGTVPANGNAVITVTFSAASLTTEELQIEVSMGCTMHKQNHNM